MHLYMCAHLIGRVYTDLSSFVTFATHVIASVFSLDWPSPVDLSVVWIA